MLELALSRPLEIEVGHYVALWRCKENGQVEWQRQVMALEEYCRVREALFRTHRLWSHFPNQKDVWRRIGLDDKVCSPLFTVRFVGA